MTSEDRANRDKDHNLGHLVSPRACVDRKPSQRRLDRPTRELGNPEHVFGREHKHSGLQDGALFVGNG